MALEHGIRLSAPQSAARRQALAPRVGHTGRPEAEGATFSPGIVTPVASLVDLPYLAAIVTRGDGLAACALGGGLVWRRPEPETRDWPDGMMLLPIDRYAVDAAVRGMRRCAECGGCARCCGGGSDVVGAAGARWAVCCSVTANATARGARSELLFVSELPSRLNP